MSEQELKKVLDKYLNKGEAEALLRYNKGEQFFTSTSIDEDTILAGYGKLDYDFEFPLPYFLIKMIYGTLSWGEYLKNKKR